MKSSNFRLRLGLIVFIGLLVRISYILIFKRDEVLGGDALVYHLTATGNVQGHWFANVGELNFGGGTAVPAADHPPLFASILTLASFLGIDTMLGHRVIGALIGTGTVAVVGLVGRRVVGERVGLIGAGIFALYPYAWLPDGNVMAESPTMLFVALTLLTAYRYADSPTAKRCAVFGVMGALAALSRSETLFLLPLAALALFWHAHKTATLRIATRHVAIAAIAAAAVMAPWVMRNMVAFQDPVYLSSGWPVILENANCDQTYYGEFLGYWHHHCVGPWRSLDESVRERDAGDRGRAYIGSHKRRVPVVVAARIGRIAGTFRPFQQVEFDGLEGREQWASRLGLFSWWVLAPLGAVGAVILRRRRILVAVLLAPCLQVLISVSISAGITRYRAPGEIAVVVLAAVTIDALVSRTGSNLKSK